jgi:hypothetical protein
MSRRRVTPGHAASRYQHWPARMPWECRALMECKSARTADKPSPSRWSASVMWSARPRRRASRMAWDSTSTRSLRISIMAASGCSNCLIRVLNSANASLRNTPKFPEGLLFGTANAGSFRVVMSRSVGSRPWSFCLLGATCRSSLRVLKEARTGRWKSKGGSTGVLLELPVLHNIRGGAKVYVEAALSIRHDRVNSSASRQAGCNAALPAGATMGLMATARGRIQEQVVEVVTVIAGLASPPALVADCGAR